MPVPNTVKDFTSLIEQSKLMTTEELRRKVAGIKLTGKDADDLELVRRILIIDKHLTDYQAALILRGHTEGFFLGPYKIMELIGKGRMAGVYKAVHSSGQIVAIKVLPASKAKDADTLARFRREGQLLTKLDHPNVVRAFHIGESAGKHFVVLEYLDGETLEEVLEKSKRMPVVEAVRIIHQAFLGLQHIYERGMIHRDLKPANLMLGEPSGSDTTGATVKILDIGLGKSVFDEALKSPVDDPSQLTTDGVLIGTPAYLAPEQARSAKSADIRSDIYSLGCVLYHALTGQPPFPDQSILNAIMRHATEPPRPLFDFLPDAPDGLQSVINWMLAKDPAQRYPTPERAAQALQVFLRSAPDTKPARRVVPAYSKWLESDSDAELNKPAQPPHPPVAKLDGSVRKPDSARPPGQKNPVVPPAPPRVSAPSAEKGKFDVELVSPTPRADKEPESEQRSLFDLNRRDAIMLFVGAMLVILAILAGWGFSKLVGSQPPDPSPPLNNPAHPVEG